MIDSRHAKQIALKENEIPDRYGSSKNWQLDMNSKTARGASALRRKRLSDRINAKDEHVSSDNLNLSKKGIESCDYSNPSSSGAEETRSLIDLPHQVKLQSKTEANHQEELSSLEESVACSSAESFDQSSNEQQQDLSLDESTISGDFLDSLCCCAPFPMIPGEDDSSDIILRTDYSEEDHKKQKYYRGQELIETFYETYKGDIKTVVGQYTDAAIITSLEALVDTTDKLEKCETIIQQTPFPQIPTSAASCLMDSTIEKENQRQTKQQKWDKLVKHLEIARISHEIGQATISRNNRKERIHQPLHQSLFSDEVMSQGGED